jgi:hypothetical protein
VRINSRRVLAGGLVAGVISLSALAMVPMVGAQMDAVLEARGVPPLGTGAMVYVVVQSLIFGVVLVWFVGYCTANVSNVMYGFMPVSPTIVGTAWGLVELVVAGVVGARLYRDESSTESVRRAAGSGMPRR